MKPIKDIAPELLQSGIYKDLEPVAVPLWVDSQNVYPTDRGLAPIPGAELLYTVPELITGLAQASVSGNMRAYVGGRTKGWYFTPTTLIEIINSMADSNRMRIETWGSWAVFNNGLERPRLWKNTGIGAAMGTAPFTWAQHMKRFKVHMLAANTSNDPNNLEWCSADDIEDWDAANPANTAGNLLIRDLDGPILGMFNLGQNISLYANETLVTVSYLGNAFVIGALPTVKGVGVWGGEAVCDLGGMNFGFGPQGIFRTDGGTFAMLDDDKVKKYVAENIDQSRREETNTWHNEVTKMVEFCFFDLGGVHRRLCYDYGRNQFWLMDKKLHRAVERQMFAFAVGSYDDKLLYVNKGTNWAGEAIAGYVQSKPDDYGDDNRAKTINSLVVNGNQTGWNLKVEAMETPTATPWTVSDAPCVLDNWMNAEAPYFKMRLYFSTALSTMQITNVAVFGVVTGNK